MCSRAWVAVAFFCLLVAAVRVQKSGGAGPDKEAKKASAVAADKPAVSTSSPVLESFEGEGYGSGEKAQEEAEQNALEDARTKVIAFLASPGHSLKWQPDLDYVRSELITGKKVEKPKDPFFGSEKVTLSVAVTQKTYEDMQKQDRKLRVEERQVLLAKILAGLLAGLVAIAFYFRLDDATKGYYTTLLRVASVALVVTVGAGVWLLL
jgi:hypothetical protein